MILNILPSRNRADNVKRFYKYWKQHCTGLCETVLVVDDDDPVQYDYADWTVVRYPRMSTVEKSNKAAAEFIQPQHRAVTQLADDMVLETHGWDATVLERLAALGTKSIIAPVDGQNHSLTTSAFMSRGMYDTLGWILCPYMQHLWVDHVWRDLLNALAPHGKSARARDIMVRHLHFSHGGGVERDETYQHIYTPERATADKTMYRMYKAKHFANDIERLLK